MDNIKKDEQWLIDRIDEYLAENELSNEPELLKDLNNIKKLLLELVRSRKC